MPENKRIIRHQNDCFQYKINECNGACIEKESPSVYNHRVLEFIEKTRLKKTT